MDHEFWHERWSDGRIGFHEAAGNALLQHHFGRLGVPEGGRVFVPLCGKTRDIGWLLAAGYRVVAAELSEIAVRDLFADLGLVPDITHADGGAHWAAPGLDVFVGDVFALKSAGMGPVDGVLDRAALVALPQDMRAPYAEHVAALTQGAPILQITFEYAPGAITGPPFSVDIATVAALYAQTHHVTELETVAFAFRGGADALEHALLLSPV